MARLRKYRKLYGAPEVPPEVEQASPAPEAPPVDEMEAMALPVKQSEAAPERDAAPPEGQFNLIDSARAFGARWLRSAYHGRCVVCENAYPVGSEIFWKRKVGCWHVACEATRVARQAERDAGETATPPVVEADGADEEPQNGNSIDAAIDRRIAKRLGAFKPESALTPEQARTIAVKASQEVVREAEETIRKIASEAAAAQAKAYVIVKVERQDGKVVEVEGAHYLFPRLVKLLGAGMHVYLWGPAGTGKTTAALMAAEAVGRKGEIDTLDPTTPKSSVLGYRTPTGKPVETAFTRCYGEGHVYIADECDNAPAHVQTLFNSALANGHAPAAWGLIPRHGSFGFVGTGNTPGRATPAFPDRRPMSAAFADRLYFMHWPLDPAIECRAAGIPAPAAPERIEKTCNAQMWVRWVQAVRAWATESAPTLQVTPRASLLGLQALALGETPEEVAHGLVFRGADKALVSKALAACPLPRS